MPSSTIPVLRCTEMDGNPEPGIKVLHLIAGNLYGGVETLLRTLAEQRHLCRAMEPHFALCYEGRSSNELRTSGAPVHMLGPARLSRPWTVARARLRLRKVLDSERFPVVICHMAWTMAMFGRTAHSAGARVIFWAHGWQSGRGLLDRLARRITPDLTISNSQHTASSMINMWPATNNRFLYNPVERPLLLERDRWRAGIRREIGATDASTVVIQVSRLEAWKGHRLHLRALSLLKDLSGWVCWFVGGPQNVREETYLAELKKCSKELGIADRVRFLGQRSDVRNLMAAADIFCQPNEAPEPFGIVFIEALWAGLPVISMQMGGAAEILDESCGLLVKPGDVESLAASLRLLIESREMRSQLGKAGPERAAELCDPAHQIQALRDLVGEVAG